LTTSKNSQILLIENVLSNLNESINEKEEIIQNFEEESHKLKNTISTLKHECKTSFNEQERLDESILDLKKQNIFLSQELKIKEENIQTKSKELDTIKIKHEQFVDKIEKSTWDLKQELENKNSIISELENINKELNRQVHHTKKEKTTSVSTIKRQLEKEEFKNFINTDNNYAFESKQNSEDRKVSPKYKSRKKQNIQLDKLESILKQTKEKVEILPEKSISNEEELIKKNLGI
jgi:chromosome segregation ATPase